MRVAAKSAFEVTLPRRGELTTRDLRAALGAELAGLQRVDVLVLDAEGRSPLAVSIELTRVRAGWSKRCALRCPTCEQARHLLLGRGGKVQCSGCHRLRTRRQTERTCSDFVRRGGREEDRLLRLLLPRAKGAARANLERARLLAERLVTLDRDRVDVLREQLETLRAATQGLP